jgi:hypothetical protein
MPHQTPKPKSKRQSRKPEAPGTQMAKLKACGLNLPQMPKEAQSTYHAELLCWLQGFSDAR